MKHVDVGPSIYIGFYKSINDKDPKFKVSDNVKMSKYEIILQKLTFQIRLKKLLCLKKFKILRRVNMLLVILTV